LPVVPPTPSAQTGRLTHVEADLPPITVLTFIVELPYAVPIPGNCPMIEFDARTPGWDGWPADQLAILLGDGAPQFPAHLVPGVRTVVRHVDVVTTCPLFAASTAFADWVEPVLSEAAVAARRAETAAWSSGLGVVRSVVALTRFVPRSEHPVAADMTVGWMRALFQPALVHLNGTLQALGLTGAGGR